MSAIALAAKASWGYPQSWLSAWESLLRITPEYVQRELVWVGAVETVVVAFYSLENRDGAWRLEHFWVEPRFQSRGVGRRLFQHAIEQVRARGPGVLVIEADPHAAEFYKTMGAHEVGSVPAPQEGEPDRRLPILEMRVDPA